MHRAPRLAHSIIYIGALTVLVAVGARAEPPAAEAFAAELCSQADMACAIAQHDLNADGQNELLIHADAEALYVYWVTDDAWQVMGTIPMYGSSSYRVGENATDGWLDLIATVHDITCNDDITYRFDGTTYVEAGRVSIEQVPDGCDPGAVPPEEDPG